MNYQLNFKYMNNYKVEIVHLDSNEKMITDAPKDNNGAGSSFSPTDLIASGLGSCIITIMAIAANTNGISKFHADATIEKVMCNSPRMISDLNVEIKLSDNLTKKERTILERAALNCPVHRSLDGKINQSISFLYI